MGQDLARPLTMDSARLTPRSTRGYLLSNVSQDLGTLFEHV
jgi:hypothetical protein